MLHHQFIFKVYSFLSICFDIIQVDFADSITKSPRRLKISRLGESAVRKRLRAYLEGEDAANEEEDHENQAHVVGGHDVLFVGECPRLGGREGYKSNKEMSEVKQKTGSVLLQIST